MSPICLRVIESIVFVAVDAAYQHCLGVMAAVYLHRKVKVPFQQQDETWAFAEAAEQ